MVDHRGSRSGIIASEYPAYNYAIGKCMQWFGFQHWYGRLITLLISILGIWAFHQIVFRLFNRKIALFAAMFLLFSVWFSFSRKIMPDTLSVSLVIIGMYSGLEYLRNGKWLLLLPTGLLIALGLLIKMPAAIVLAPFALILFNKKWHWMRRALVALLCVLAIVPMYWWYFKWIVHLNEFGFSLFFPRPLTAGWHEIKAHWLATLNNVVFHSFFSYIGFACFLAGLVQVARKKNWILTGVFVLGLTPFVYYMIKTGITFPYHSYYMVPFAPIMAVIAAFALTSFESKRKWLVPAIIAAVAIESIANQQSDLRITPESRTYLELEHIADSIHSRDHKIITNAGPSPTIMYFSNRIGWAIDDYRITNPLLDSLANIGAEYLYLYQFDFDASKSPFRYELYRSDFLKIYGLKP